MNHWVVFLTSDVGAEGMIAAGNPNGYAIGVNLVSANDILTLYRVTNGSFTAILSTAINWETDIGTTQSSVGAVEVERKFDGTFIVRASTEGRLLHFSHRVALWTRNMSMGIFWDILPLYH